jgi:hypothetical protein
MHGKLVLRIFALVKIIPKPLLTVLYEPELKDFLAYANVKCILISQKKNVHHHCHRVVTSAF